MDCDRAEYNFETEEGKFYAVSGSAPSQICRPQVRGLLTTTNHFYFSSEMGRTPPNGHYILYNGFLTGLPDPTARGGPSQGAAF